MKLAVRGDGKTTGGKRPPCKERPRELNRNLRKLGIFPQAKKKASRASCRCLCGPGDAAKTPEQGPLTRENWSGGEPEKAGPKKADPGIPGGNLGQRHTELVTGHTGKALLVHRGSNDVPGKRDRTEAKGNLAREIRCPPWKKRPLPLLSASSKEKSSIRAGKESMKKPGLKTQSESILEKAWPEGVPHGAVR